MPLVRPSVLTSPVDLILSSTACFSSSVASESNISIAYLVASILDPVLNSSTPLDKLNIVLIN